MSIPTFSWRTEIDHAPNSGDLYFPVGGDGVVPYFGRSRHGHFPPIPVVPQFLTEVAKSLHLSSSLEEVGDRKLKINPTAPSEPPAAKLVYYSCFHARREVFLSSKITYCHTFVAFAGTE